MAAVAQRRKWLPGTHHQLPERPAALANGQATDRGEAGAPCRLTGMPVVVADHGGLQHGDAQHSIAERQRRRQRDGGACGEPEQVKPGQAALAGRRPYRADLRGKVVTITRCDVPHREPSWVITARPPSSPATRLDEAAARPVGLGLIHITCSAGRAAGHS